MVEGLKSACELDVVAPAEPGCERIYGSYEYDLRSLLVSDGRTQLRVLQLSPFCVLLTHLPGHRLPFNNVNYT